MVSGCFWIGFCFGGALMWGFIDHPKELEPEKTHWLKGKHLDIRKCHKAWWFTSPCTALALHQKRSGNPLLSAQLEKCIEDSTETCLDAWATAMWKSGWVQGCCWISGLLLLQSLFYSFFPAYFQQGFCEDWLPEWSWVVISVFKGGRGLMMLAYLDRGLRMLQVIGKIIDVGKEDSVQAKGHGCARWLYRRKCRSQTSDNMDRWSAEARTVREENESKEKETVDVRSRCAKR